MIYYSKNNSMLWCRLTLSYRKIWNSLSKCINKKRRNNIKKIDLSICNKIKKIDLSIWNNNLMETWMNICPTTTHDNCKSTPHNKNRRLISSSCYTRRLTRNMNQSEIHFLILSRKIVQTWKVDRSYRFCSNL